MKKILVPTDFSEYAYYALKVAAQIAKKNDTLIVTSISDSIYIEFKNK
jgi:nucleotide-binding universal stress UspA family protein